MTLPGLVVAVVVGLVVLLVAEQIYDHCRYSWCNGRLPTWLKWTEQR